MKEILRFDKLPSEYTSNFIGSGENGSVYKIDDNSVFKAFNNPSYFEGSIKELFKMYSTSFVLPKKLVYVDDRFIGYIMDYVGGIKLTEMNENTSINKYIKSVRTLEYDLVALTLHDIYVFDFNDKNIRINESGEIKALDTDYYCTDKSKDLYTFNIANVSPALLLPFLNLYTDTIKDSRLDYYRRQLLDGRYLPSKFIENIRDYTSSGDCNVSEFKNQVQLILK